MEQPPDRAERRGAHVALWVATSLAALYTLGIGLIPVLESLGFSGSSLFRLAYAPLCHQLADRSLELAGHPLAVCSRCAGLFLGGCLGLVSAILASFRTTPAPRPVWFLVLVAPTVVDALLPWIGLPSLANEPRLVVAVAAGWAGGLFLAVGLIDLGRMIHRHRRLRSAF